MKHKGKILAVVLAGVALLAVAATYFGSVAVVNTIHGETNYIHVVLGNHAASVTRKISPSNLVDVLKPVGLGEPRLAADVSAAATAITVTTAPSNTTTTAYVAIDPGTTNCEIREISSISGRTVNVIGSGGAFPLKYAHTAGCAVFFFNGGPFPLTLFGAVPNVNTTAIAAQNVTAFNRLATNLYLMTAGVPKRIFLDGNFYINGECRIERDQHLTGLQGQSGLTAHSSFDFSANVATNKTVAMLHWMRDGVLVRFIDGAPFTKIYMDGFTLNGAGITNSVGMLISAQQPAYGDNIRIDSCDDGAIICGSQIYKMRNWEFFSNRRALRYRAATMVYAYDFDFQQTIEKEFDSDNLDGAGFCNNNHFIGLEVESIGGAPPVSGTNFTFRGSNWKIQNVYFNNPASGGTFLRFAEGGSAGYPVFTIEGLAVGNAGSYHVIDDMPRGLFRTADDVNRNIQKIVSGVYTLDWSEEVVGSQHGGIDPPPGFWNGISLSRRTNYAGVWIRAGSINPEGALPADPGCIWINTNGGAGTTLYVKETGFSSTGWAAK